MDTIKENKVIKIKIVNSSRKIRYILPQLLLNVNMIKAKKNISLSKPKGTKINGGEKM